MTLEHFKTLEEQEEALNILQFKIDVLWTMLDAIHVTYGIGPDKLGAVERMQK